MKRKIKVIYGGANKQAHEFAKVNYLQLKISGLARTDCYRIANSHEALRGLRGDKFEVLAVGSWKSRAGSGKFVRECKIKNIDILTENGYFIKDGKEVW